MSSSQPALAAPESLLPHRAPFLFVDQLQELIPGQRASGMWSLTGDEDFFSGHFPGRPTLPGVLMLEALAQVGACAVLAHPEYGGKIPLFGGADKVKFRQQVVPGDSLELSVEMTQISGRAGKGTGQAKLHGKLACQAQLLFVLVDAD